MTTLLINTPHNINIYTYLEYLQDKTISQTIEFNGTDSNKIIVTLKDETGNTFQQKIIYKDYSSYFSLSDSLINTASIKDLFDNVLFYQSPMYKFNVIYQNTTYLVNKVMNLGCNTIMLLEPLV